MVIRNLFQWCKCKIMNRTCNERHGTTQKICSCENLSDYLKERKLESLPPSIWLCGQIIEPLQPNCYMRYETPSATFFPSPRLSTHLMFLPFPSAWHPWQPSSASPAWVPLLLQAASRTQWPS